MMRCATISEMQHRRTRRNQQMGSGIHGSGVLDRINEHVFGDEMGGEGIMDFIDRGRAAISNALPDSDSNARKMYPGERHALLKLANGKYGRASFMGPGTQLVSRLKRGDPPRTLSDKVAKRHDIDYALSTDVAGIRAADKRMVKSIQRIKKAGTDSRFNTLQGEKLIQMKMKLEDLGVDPLRFAKFGGVSEADKPLVLAEKKKLEQEGYGVGGKKKKSSKKLPPGLKLRRSLLKKTHKKKYNKTEVDAAVANIMKTLKLS